MVPSRYWRASGHALARCRKRRWHVSYVNHGHSLALDRGNTLLAGILYVVFIGEPTAGVQRHPAWPYIGWAIVAFVIVSIGGTALWGYTQLYIRSEIAKGVAGVERGTSPSENNQAHPQRPLSFENRNLQPNQIRVLNEQLPTLRPFMKTAFIAYTNNDMETLSVADQYVRSFERSGIVPAKLIMDPSGPEDEGLLIFVKDKSAIPIAAQKLMEIFAIADIHPVVRDDRSADLVRFGVEFIFFVAPAHID
jgi:hypothetical protein